MLYYLLLEWRVMSSCEQRLTDLVRRRCLRGESCHPVSRDWRTWSEDVAWVESCHPVDCCFWWASTITFHDIVEKLLIYHWATITPPFFGGEGTHAPSSDQVSQSLLTGWHDSPLKHRLLTKSVSLCSQDDMTLYSSNVFWPSQSVSAHMMTWLSTQAMSSDQVSQSLLTGWHDSTLKQCLLTKSISLCSQDDMTPLEQRLLTKSVSLCSQDNMTLHSSNVFWPSQSVSAHRMTWLHSSNVFWPSQSVSAHRMTW
jgi:hypothetical protein